jgi:vacuolar-type H+-ATPase subunit I/STV1
MGAQSTHTKHDRQGGYVPASSRKAQRTTTFISQLQAHLEAVAGGQALDDIERGLRIKEQREALHLTQPAVVELMEQAAWGLSTSDDLHPSNAGKPPLTLRGLQTYEAGGGIVWGKAKLLAQVLQMDVQVMLNGERRDEERTPEPLPVRRDGGEDRLARIEDAIAAMRQERADEAQAIRDLLAQQDALLERQTKLLERIEARLSDDHGVRDEIADLIDRTRREIVQAGPLEAETDPPPVPEPTAAAPKSRAKAQRPR